MWQSARKRKGFRGRVRTLGMAAMSIRMFQDLSSLVDEGHFKRLIFVNWSLCKLTVGLKYWQSMEGGFSHVTRTVAAMG